MKIFYALTAAACLFIGSTYANAKERLTCEFANGYFRVSDGLQNWQEYVTSADAADVKIECGKMNAAAIVGSYFVSFSEGSFKEKYIGSSTPQNRVLKVKGNMAAAAIGSYFVVVRNGGEILTKYVGSAESTPSIAVSKDVAIAIFDSYFIATEGVQIRDKYVGSGAAGQLAATDSLGAALIGNYFLGFTGGQILEKYVPSTSADARIARGSYLLATSTGAYFLVLDGHRNQILETYVGSTGKVRIVNEIPVFTADSGQTKRYNSATGRFE